MNITYFTALQTGPNFTTPSNSPPCPKYDPVCNYNKRLMKM